MPADLRDPTDPREWLRRARSNLALARIGRQGGVLLEDLCFEAQQAAEKAVKAVLVSRSLRFPKTHVISELLTLAAAGGVTVPPSVREAEALTPYAVAARYPGAGEDVTPEELDAALSWGQQVLDWAAALIEGEAEAKPRGGEP